MSFNIISLCYYICKTFRGANTIKHAAAVCPAVSDDCSWFDFLMVGADKLTLYGFKAATGGGLAAHQFFAVSWRSAVHRGAGSRRNIQRQPRQRARHTCSDQTGADRRYRKQNLKLRLDVTWGVAMFVGSAWKKTNWLLLSVILLWED